MTKSRSEPIRRKALIDATIAAIGANGSLDVTMSEIAGRAGVSSALAHHYFGAKSSLIEATMRHILAELGADACKALGAAATPRQRISAVINVSFSPSQFQPEIIASWLIFYVEAQRVKDLQRLLRIYAHRLHSNLMSALSPLLPRTEAGLVAESIAALIDGLYIRRALKEGQPDAGSAIALVEDYVTTKLGQSHSQAQNGAKP